MLPLHAVAQEATEAPAESKSPEKSVPAEAEKSSEETSDSESDEEADSLESETEAEATEPAEPAEPASTESLSQTRELEPPKGDTVPEPAFVPMAESKVSRKKRVNKPKQPDGLSLDKSVEEQKDEEGFLDQGDVRWTIDPEYRVRTLAIDPLEVNGTTVTETHWTEQRFRLDTTVAKAGVGAIRLQADFLDGVLFGDNGSVGSVPASNSGVSLTSNRPNVTRWDIGLPSGADPLDRESYVPTLVPADLWSINYLYADVFLPFGLIRVGRQPKKYGAGIPSHDGGPYNRWGVSKHSDAADRILFGTKIDEAFYVMLYGYQHVVDPSMENGLIFAVFYDWQAQDQIYIADDDLTSIGGTLEFRREETDWFGLDWKDVLVSVATVYLTNDQFDSNVFAMPASIQGQLEDLKLTLNYMLINGKSREISEGFAELSGTDPEIQEIRAHGFQAIIDYFLGPLTLTMEFDLATGDDDPRVTTPLTTFNFARDMNVGLLLFEHIMAFETARSAAVGIENLSGLDAASFPLTEISTEGRFTNGIVLFPQVKIDIVDTLDHDFHTRLGALFAWSEASGGVVDPIITSLSEDGEEITDDAVNFHGGDPARFYGTELDLQLGYTYKQYFIWTVEGAVLFPGEALHDANGDAVNSFLVENRFEFRF